MNVVRSLERRLERLMDGVAGRIFSGRIHPSELAGKLAREADFARFEHETGQATGNHFIIGLNPRDIPTDSAELSRVLAEAVSAHAADEGLRLEGPSTVDITPVHGLSAGTVQVHVEVVPGPLQPWARLVAESQTCEIGHNRASIGRSEDSDVVLTDPSISRHHAVIWRQDGQTWIQDLDSSNGTTVDRVPVGADPVQVNQGAVVAFGQSKYRYLET